MSMEDKIYLSSMAKISPVRKSQSIENMKSLKNYYKTNEIPFDYQFSPIQVRSAGGGVKNRKGGYKTTEIANQEVKNEKVHAPNPSRKMADTCT